MSASNHAAVKAVYAAGGIAAVAVVCVAADLAATPTSGLRVQCCGDAHLCNFGSYATPERRIIFDVNDLDETLPAPWEWDVKRLAASFVLAQTSCRGCGTRIGTLAPASSPAGSIPAAPRKASTLVAYPG